MQYFSNAACDWTPQLAKGVSKVIFVPFVPEQEVTQLCLAALAKTEVLRSSRFGTSDLKARFIQRRAFRRYCAALRSNEVRPLVDLDFDETEKGRPFLSSDPTKWFSFSSCKQGFLGAWSSTHAVGVDVEDNSRTLNFAEMAQGYFSPEEAKCVLEAGSEENQKRVFMKLWCLKEAALKSIGEGLPFGMDKFQFSLNGEPEIIGVPWENGDESIYSAYLSGDPQVTVAVVVRRLS